MEYILFIITAAFLLSLQIFLGTNKCKSIIEKTLGTGFLKHFYRFIYIAISFAIYTQLISYFMRLEYLEIFNFKAFFNNIFLTLVPNFPYDNPYLIVDLFRVIFIVMIIESIYELGFLEFIGIKQILLLFSKHRKTTKFKGNRIRAGIYMPRGPYQRHRQPALFYLLLYIILSDALNWNNIIFLLIFVPYYLVNSSLQEDRFLEDYGDSYKEYKGTVAMLLPRLKRYFGHENNKK